MPINKETDIKNLRNAILEQFDILNVGIYSRRLIAVYLVSTKQSAEQVGEMFAVNSQTVRRWCERYNLEGLNGLKDRPRKGRPAVLNEERWKEMIAAEEQDRRANRRRPRWGTADVANYLKEKFQIELSERQCLRIKEQLRLKGR